jgi:hypothetical protein
MQFYYRVVLCILFTIFSATAFAQSPAAPVTPNATNTTPAASRAVLTPREIAQRSLPSVVMLALETERVNAIKYGSGFFVAPDVVATNFHVIENTTKGYVKIVGKEPIYEILGLVGIDRSNDLALVKVKGIRGTQLPIGNSNSLAIGDEVFAVGNPKGLEGTFSQGIVSSIRQDGKESVIQITAPISQGSSGGPILNAQGEVIGIAFSGLSSGQALNFAIPSSYLKTLLSNSKPLVTLLAGARGARFRPTYDHAKVSTEDEELPIEEATPARKRSSTPSMSNESIALDRSAPIRRKGFSELQLVVNGAKHENFNSDDCTFRMPFDGFALVDSNRNGIADSMAIEANCSNKNILLAFTTERMGRDLVRGIYEKAMHPSSFKGHQLPGLALIRQLPDGKIIPCNDSSTGRFQILDVEFELMNNKFYLNAFQANFDLVCMTEKSGIQNIRGTLYYNYPQKKGSTTAREKNRK